MFQEDEGDEEGGNEEKRGPGGAEMTTSTVDGDDADVNGKK